MTNQKLNELSINEITKLIDKLETSPFNYLEVENEEYKIVIGKDVVQTVQAAPSQSAETQAVQSVQAVSVAERSVEEAPAQPAASVQSQPVEAPKQESAKQEGIVTVTATTTGIYYAQPEPGSAPYVKVGDDIKADSTVGLIEIMKVYSAIPAGVEGEVVEIHVTDAQLIEYGDPLISVKVK